MTTALFPNLRPVLFALAAPEHERALRCAIDHAVLAWGVFAITSKGPAFGRQARSGARKYDPPFRWQIESADEAREVLIARGLWPERLDEWRHEPTQFRAWDSRLNDMADKPTPTLAEVVSIAAHGPALLGAISAFEKDAPTRARRLVLHGLRTTSNGELGAFRMSPWRDALIAQYPKPWGYGQSMYGLKRALAASRAA